MKLKDFSLFKTDFYKVFHSLQYEVTRGYITSYLFMRGNMLKEDGIDHAIIFGLQQLIEEKLHEEWQEHFFSIPKSEFPIYLDQYLNFILNDSKIPCYKSQIENKFKDLYDLGYLPIKICTIDEGTFIEPNNIPILSIVNTHEDFPWLPGFLETLILSESWYSIILSTVYAEFKKLALNYYIKTVDNAYDKVDFAFSEFGTRGGQSLETSLKASEAFGLYFRKSANVATTVNLSEYYSAPIDQVSGTMSTEHSVMCLNQSKERYNQRAIYEYYLVKDYLDKLRLIDPNLIIEGDVVKCTKMFINYVFSLHDFIVISTTAIEISLTNDIYTEDKFKRVFQILDDTTCKVSDTFCEYLVFQRLLEKFPEGNISIVSDSYDYWNVLENIIPYFKEYIENRQGTLFVRPDSGNIFEMCVKSVEILDSIFGTTVNKKGYKVLPPYIRVVYADGITLKRASVIYRLLEEKGYSVENITLGCGAFSAMALEREDGTFNIFTRDTFKMAIKATYYTNKMYLSLDIEKNPKTDSGKKSPAGLLGVYSVNDSIMCLPLMKQEGAYVGVPLGDNLLIPRYENGYMCNKQSFKDIRNKINRAVLKGSFKSVGDGGAIGIAGTIKTRSNL